MSLPLFKDRTSPDLIDQSGFTHIWRAGELDGTVLQTVASGHRQLDIVLPGQGWPQGALIEVLQPQAGLHEWGLLAPGLNAVQCTAGAASDKNYRSGKGSKSIKRDQMGTRLLILVNPPRQPFGPALGAWRIDMPRMLCINGSDAPSLLWATREALQCADVAAVLAWLPDARSAHLRRLQIAAHAHNKLLFVFRPLRAQHESSPAPLRLLLEGALRDDDPVRANVNMNVRVTVLKRRGPPLASPILLDTRPARLAALLAASRERLRRQREEALENAPMTPAVAPPVATPVTPTVFTSAIASTLLPDLLTALVHGPAVTTSADGRAGLTVSTTLTAPAIGSVTPNTSHTTALDALLDRLAHFDQR
jgi:protein ImuA